MSNNYSELLELKEYYLDKLYSAENEKDVIFYESALENILNDIDKLESGY